MIKFAKILPVWILSLIWIASAQAITPGKLTPVIEGADLYQLEDQTYYFPANYAPDDPTVFLPLQRWDFIFTGDHINQSDSVLDLENVNNLIPGPFNHMMVYMGKDPKGLAYAIELNISSLEEGGGIALICLGSDFGILRHPDTSRLQDNRLMTHRWARRLVDAAYDRLRTNEAALLERLYADLAIKFPYQLELEHSGNFWDLYIYLVDDGFEGGASCSDYWTTLFETTAGLCIKNTRMSVEDCIDYFRTDPQGIQAYIPPEISPFPGMVLIRELLDIGFQVIPDQPHVFVCDNTEETGLVLPFLILQSDQLEDIPPLKLPFPLSWFLSFQKKMDGNP